MPSGGTLFCPWGKCGLRGVVAGGALCCRMPLLPFLNALRCGRDSEQAKQYENNNNGVT